MTLPDVTNQKCYADYFWNQELDNVSGTDALVRRNKEGKQLCQDVEEYLKKRAKLEMEYSKSLAGLVKCFRGRDDVGVLEASVSALRDELHQMGAAHQRAGERLSKMAEDMRRFKDTQGQAKKAIEETLRRAQDAKLSNLSKTIQAQKMYVKKSTERDTAELAHKQLMSSASRDKDIEKMKIKAIKCEEDAQKADTTYQSTVMVLNSSIENWEEETVNACKAVQELDEERIRESRQVLWSAVNVDSQLALDIDDRCEVIRDVLEKVDLDSEVRAFIASAGTGCKRPAVFQHTHYSKLIAITENDSSSFNVYTSVDDDSNADRSSRNNSTNSNSSVGSNNNKTGLMSSLGVSKVFRKKSEKD